MKKFLFIIIPVFLATPVWAQPVSMAFNPKVGSCLKFEMIRNTGMIQAAISDADIQIDMQGSNSTYYQISFTTLERVKDLFVVEFCCDSISFSAHTAAVSSFGDVVPGVAYKSSDFFPTGKPIILHISKQGKLVEMQGIDALVDQFESGNKLKMMGIDPTTIVTFMIQDLVRLVIPEYTSGSLVIGKEWDCSQHLDAGMYQFIEHLQYKLNSFDNTTVSLSLSSIIEPDENDKFFEMLGMKAKMNMSGTSTGTLQVERDTGWVTSFELQKSIKVRSIFENAPVALPPSVSRETITVKRL